jgi:hypothetical protein
MQQLNTLLSRYAIQGYDQNKQANTQKCHERKHGQHVVVFIDYGLRCISPQTRGLKIEKGQKNPEECNELN